MTRNIIIAIIAAGIVGFFIYQGQSPENLAKQRKRDMIELCWQDQAKKSNDPATARLLAGMCENFESDFVKEYHVKP
jgi:glutamate synthase domain-containing protein 3